MYKVYCRVEKKGVESGREKIGGRRGGGEGASARERESICFMRPI